jgi:hypothetical protein
MTEKSRRPKSGGGGRGYERPPGRVGVRAPTRARSSSLCLQSVSRLRSSSRPAGPATSPRAGRTGGGRAVGPAVAHAEGLAFGRRIGHGAMGVERARASLADTYRNVAMRNPVRRPRERQFGRGDGSAPNPACWRSRGRTDHRDVAAACLCSRQGLGFAANKTSASEADQSTSSDTGLGRGRARALEGGAAVQAR